MKDLIGFRCHCVFNLPSHEWPIAGYPAWVVVDAVDMPMVKMHSAFAGEPMWVNASLIKTISAVDRAMQPAPWWVRLLMWTQ